MSRNPIVVPMEDPITHTVAQPICGEEGCICYELEREQAEEAERRAMFPRQHRTTLVSSPPVGIDASLNGQRGFSLLR